MTPQNKIPQGFKDPGERWPFGIDWSDQLEAGETITSNVWEIENISDTVTVVKVNASETVIGSVALAVFENGANGEVCYLKNTVGTSNGSTGVRRIELRIGRL